MPNAALVDPLPVPCTCPPDRCFYTHYKPEHRANVRCRGSSFLPEVSPSPAEQFLAVVDAIVQSGHSGAPDAFTKERIELVAIAFECAVSELRKGRPGNARTCINQAVRIIDSTWGPPHGVDPLEVLRYVEWAAETLTHEGEEVPACPFCDGEQSRGHAQDCKLALALATQDFRGEKEGNPDA